LKVTPSGEIILKHAKEVVEREHNVKNRLSASSVEVKGTLSIACSSLISQRYLPKILAKFTKQYPLVTVDLVTRMSEDIKQRSENYHVSIIRGDKMIDYTSFLLFKVPLYIFYTEPFEKVNVKMR